MQNMDWKNIGFGYIKTDYRYISYYKDGKWDDGTLSKDDTITIHESSTCIHYGQQAFEGLKAYRRKDGRIQLFRPDENAKRFILSCKRLLIPEISIEQFIDAVVQVVKANESFVPPYGYGATLYIRPYVIGIGENIGVKPAKEYLFGIFCIPVGNYYKGEMKPVNFIVTEYDRAAPNGTGCNKVGGNYASSLVPHQNALDNGFTDCIYLDPITHTKIEEAGTANFFGITHDNEFVTPKSNSILPGITKNSLMYISRNILNIPTIERDVYINKLDEFKEAGACGTAAVITPIGAIEYNNHLHTFYSQTEVGPITKKLYETLIKIQFGDLEAPSNWVYII